MFDITIVIVVSLIAFGRIKKGGCCQTGCRSNIFIAQIIFRNTLMIAGNAIFKIQRIKPYNHENYGCNHEIVGKIFAIKFHRKAVLAPSTRSNYCADLYTSSPITDSEI